MGKLLHEWKRIDANTMAALLGIGLTAVVSARAAVYYEYFH